MSAISEGVLVVLRAANVGGTGWRLGIGTATTTPKTQIIVSDSPGMPPNAAWRLDFPMFQVMVRGDVDGYQVAMQKAQNAFDALHALPPQTVNGDHWDGVWAMHNPNFVGNDENGCPLISTNYRAIVEPAAGTNRAPL